MLDARFSTPVEKPAQGVEQTCYIDIIPKFYLPHKLQLIFENIVKFSKAL